jgi:hypothetical protein
MPVIFDSSADALWLDPRSSADAVRSLFVPFASERMEALPVSAWVSDPKHGAALPGADGRLALGKIRVERQWYELAPRDEKGVKLPT